MTSFEAPLSVSSYSPRRATSLPSPSAESIRSTFDSGQNFDAMKCQKGDKGARR